MRRIALIERLLAAFRADDRMHADRVQRLEQHTDTWPLVAATLHPDTSEATRCTS